MTDEGNPLAVAPGPIKCGDVERRRLLEELGREDRIDEFIGDAAEAGRQAEEDDHLEEDDQDENTDPYAEAFADE